MELDHLYKRLHRPHADRLALLQKYPQLIERRDDLALEEITLLNQTGCYEEAMRKLDSRTFHPWEGGEGKVSAQYQICRVELAKQLIGRAGQEESGDNRKKALLDAISLLQECLVFPHNLGEGKLYGAQDNDFYFFLGKAYAMLADLSENEADKKHLLQRSTDNYRLGTAGPTEPAAAMYYNDAKPDKIFYAALCYRALGDEKAARGLFHKLISYGEKHIFDHITMDYFAVSLPDLLVWDGNLDEANRVHCNYMLALGNYGLGNVAQGAKYLSTVLALNVNHDGARALQSFISK